MDTVLSKISKFQRRMKTIFDPFEGKRPRVLILGLDGAGKTTLLYHAKLDDTIYANVPPRGINIEHMTPRRGASMQVYDMTGNKVARHMWRQWFRGVEALVYVVDSADRVRLDEAKFELHEMLKSRDLRRVPVTVVANKQDLEDSAAIEIVKRELDLDSINDRDWSIFGTSATKGSGISKVFKDTVDKIKAFRHYKSGLQAKPDGRRSSKKSVKSEKTDETKSVSNCSSIEEQVKIKSLFEHINEGKDTEVEHVDGGNSERKDSAEASSSASEFNSNASAKYDEISMNNKESEEDNSVDDEKTSEEETAGPDTGSEDGGYNAEPSEEQNPRPQDGLSDANENKTYGTATDGGDSANIGGTSVNEGEICY